MTGFKPGTGNPFEDDQEDALADDEPDTVDQESTTDSVDLDDLPYLAERQLRGESVNVDRDQQLRLRVRPFVVRNEVAFIQELQEDLGTSIHKADAREAAMVVAHEHPELVAEKLREWGIDYLD